jgi:hypothetical protein
MMELDGVVLHVDGTAVRTALLSSLRTCPAPAGTVVLLVLCSQAPRESGTARLKFGALGGQARQLTLA